MQSAKLEEILKRANMKRGQITLLKKLYEYEGWCPKDELAKIRDIDSVDIEPEESLVRVFGAFGRRVNSTSNVHGGPGYRAFIEKRNGGNGTQYRLRSEARKAVEADDALMEKIRNPMSELKKDGTELVRSPD